MPVIWGLDLREIQWGKFKSSYMWNNEYHLRRTKFIVYQIAMIFCVVSESLGTAALSDYVDQQDYVAAHSPSASTTTVHNDDFIGIASYNIFNGIYVATIFGSGFFFDLFWPERHESPAVKLAWKICSIFACITSLAAALGLTIIVATHGAYVTGADAGTVQRLLAEYGGSPLKYKDNGRAIASVVFLWPGMIATFASTFLLWKSLAHNDKFGPKSTHARASDMKPAPDGADGELANGAEKHVEPSNPYAGANSAPVAENGSLSAGHVPTDTGATVSTVDGSHKPVETV